MAVTYSHSNPPPGINWHLYDDDSGIIQPHEPLQEYVPGGLHTVTLGDMFHDGRYRIHNKLGYGGHSTVWLAQDIQEEQWVAIKIKKAHDSTDDLDKDPEIQAMIALEKHYLEGPQDRPRGFIQLFDSFRHEGPNGIHNCLVMELLGPSLETILRTNVEMEEFLAPDTILRTSRQLLKAIEFAHQAGFVHGAGDEASDHLLNGLTDISPGNVAFTCNQAFTDYNEEFTEAEALEEILGKPITATYIGKELPQTPHLPQQIVRTADWRMWYDCPREDIRIFDWGSAFSLTERPTFVSQPDDLRSPETIFVGSFDYRHDLWKAGSVIFTLFYQRWPFYHSWIGHLSNFYIRTLVEKLGPLPQAWNAQWDEMVAGEKEREDERNYDREEQLITDTFEPRRQAIIQQCEEVDRVYRRDEYTDDDYEGLKCLLRPMIELLRYEPDKRVSLREALSYIDWVDHRVEMDQAGMDQAENDEAENDEAENDEAENDEAEKDEAENHEEEKGEL